VSNTLDTIWVFHCEVAQQDLHHVILVGHSYSYAGLAISGVADRIPEHLEKLIYLNALLPENGQSTFSVNPKESQEPFLKLPCITIRG
jgi:hypothetical protein